MYFSNLEEDQKIRGIMYFIEADFLLLIFSLPLINPKEAMNKTISVGQFIVSLAALLCGLLGAWVSINKDTASHTARLDEMDIRINKVERSTDQFNKKLDEVNNKLGDKLDNILLLLGNKEDRKR